MVKVVDRMKQFLLANADAMDRALNRMAIDIDRLSKDVVPISKSGGHLHSSGHFRKAGYLSYKVSYNTEYARFQEFGGDATRTVRRYTYPGKKKFYLRDSGDTIASKALTYFKQEANATRL